MKIIKFHLALHVEHDILENGLMDSWNSSLLESNHKPDKACARRTQLHKELLETQTAKQKHESLCIN